MRRRVRKSAASSGGCRRHERSTGVAAAAAVMSPCHGTDAEALATHFQLRNEACRSERRSQGAALVALFSYWTLTVEIDHGASVQFCILDVSARVKSFQRMMAGMQSMAREGDYAGSNRRKRSLIDELWEQVDDEWGNVQLLHPLIATLPVLPKKEAMIALRLIRSLLKRAPGPLKTEVCTDLAGQIEPLYAQHLNGQAEQARYLIRFPGMGQRHQPDTDAPCGMAAEILVRAIKTHPRNTLSDRLFAASLDAARAQADYYLQTHHGRPRPAARKADIRAALFERGSEEQRGLIDETAQGAVAGRSGGV